MHGIYKKSLLTAAVTVGVDFMFHYFFTRPMESLTYFVIKFLLAFFVAAALFSLDAEDRQRRLPVIIFAALVFSTLMSVYYRAWELVEAAVPFGSRAPDIIGIFRGDTLLFSGVWWFAHASFFAAGVLLAHRLIRNKGRVK